MNPTGLIASFVIGYLIGGIPFAYLVGRLRGVDVRLVGSGNVGATNLGRALGRKWGLFVLTLDIAKGFLVVFFLAPLLCGLEGPGAAISGLGAVLGHVFTPYLRFKGGKGVAVSIGVFAALLWYWVALPLIGYLVVRKATGYVSAGSLTLAVLLPAAAILHARIDKQGGWAELALAVAVSAMLIWTHRSNIARLLRGEELAAPSRAERG